MGIKILKLKEVEHKIGLKKTSIYHMVDQKTFPAPIKLGPRSTGWVESELDDWVNEKIKERDTCVA